jgi:hypothetical protein
MTLNMRAMQLACRLVDEVLDKGSISDGVRTTYINMARMNPERVADMLISMASMVADATPPDLPQDEQTYRKYLRRAHAAHARGERFEWVVVGEREYQRVIQADRRARKKEGAA